MNKIAIAAALLCLAAGFSTPSFAADPCESVLCLYGKATGNSGGSDCNGPEKAFFSINSFKKHNHFNPSKTADMRKAFLLQCKAADPAAISKIISKFGRVKS